MQILNLWKIERLVKFMNYFHVRTSKMEQYRYLQYNRTCSRKYIILPTILTWREVNYYSKSVLGFRFKYFLVSNVPYGVLNKWPQIVVLIIIHCIVLTIIICKIRYFIFGFRTRDNVPLSKRENIQNSKDEYVSVRSIVHQ